MEIGNKYEEVPYSDFVGDTFQSSKLKLTLLCQSRLHYMLVFSANSVELAAQKKFCGHFPLWLMCSWHSVLYYCVQIYFLWNFLNIYRALNDHSAMLVLAIEIKKKYITDLKSW